jgi:hypothetical protein
MGCKKGAVLCSLETFIQASMAIIQSYEAVKDLWYWSGWLLLNFSTCLEAVFIYRFK